MFVQTPRCGGTYQRIVSPVPMVVEAHSGAWGQARKKMLAFIGRNVASALNDSPDAVSLKIAQRLSIALHRENAQGILKRCDRAHGAARARRAGERVDRRALVIIVSLWAAPHFCLMCCLGEPPCHSLVVLTCLL